MTAITIATSRITYRGADALNITRATGDHLGKLFAPSIAILTPALAARRHAATLRKAHAGGLFAAEHAAACAEADRIESLAWAAYEPLYLAECEAMPWRMLRDLGKRVCGVCYCVPIAGLPLRCHRTLWAREAVRRLGAVYEGEM
jgi:hypothetical protein